MFIVHPCNPRQHRVDRDFCFLINAYDVDPGPGSFTPKVNTMLDFNLWTWNSRAFPGIDHLVCRTSDRVRIRLGNLTMTNHPIHMHGVTVYVDGGVNIMARMGSVASCRAGSNEALTMRAAKSGSVSVEPA